MSATASPTATFVISAIDPDIAEQLRRRGGPLFVANSYPGFPCRQCLRDADVGDELILVSYDPFRTDSPYRCSSPIFLHAHDCAAQRDTSDLPEQIRRRTLSVRAFDANAMMLSAKVVEGSALPDLIETLFTDEHVDHIHVHNAGPGCWATRIDRPGSA